MKMAIKVDAEKCTACGTCAEVCPVDAITVEDLAVIDEEECIACGTCEAECPVEAITMED
jgi:Fe-S-cluster-containing hydrogenase component 2